MALSSTPWQEGLKTVPERIKKMWQKGFFTDHSIVVVGSNKEQEEFKVHKTILAITSPYFEGLFYGSLNNNNNITELNDIEPNVFKYFLSYVYADEFKINTFDEARKMYILADRFLMTDLKERCMDVIEIEATLSNICQAYEFCKFFNIDELIYKFEEDISKNASTIFKSPNFLEFRKETLLSILELDEMCIQSESEVYNAVLNWIKADEVHRGNSTTEEEKKNLYSSLMHRVRFLSMTAEEFSHGPGLHSYISSDDKLKFLMKITCENAPVEIPANFSSEKRMFLSSSGILTSENLHKLPKEWRTLLYTAAECGNMKKINTLYVQGADICAKYGRNKRNLLHIAASSGKLAVVEWLLNHKIQVNEKNLWGWTALHLACRSGHEQVIKKLLQRGADKHALTNSEKTPYDVAADSIKEKYNAVFEEINTSSPSLNINTAS